MTIIFPTCIVDMLRPGLASRMRGLLARRGVQSTVAHHTTCCGQPAYNAGYAAEARRVARPTLRALAKTEGPIVVPSGSCTAMMTRHWPELFANTPDAGRATAVSTRVLELTQLLALIASERSVSDDRGPVAYHGSCHLERELGVRVEPRTLLTAQGYEVREPEGADRCCGFGGTFSVKLPAVSVAMADEKLDTLAATGASTVVGCDLSCLVHLEGRARSRGLSLQFSHIAEQLDG